MKIAVVGGGIIGASAAKHLARADNEVTLFAPPEPVDPKTHDGVFSSHYDAGRITRRLDRHPVWAELAARSIAEYENIEAESGIRFYHEKGCLITAPRTEGFLSEIADIRNRTAPEAVALDHVQVKEHFPYLSLPSGHAGFWEQSRAGYVDPRAFVAAQMSCFGNAGGKVIERVVSHLDDLSDFDHILLTAGPFTNMVAQPKLDLTVLARTISIFELTPEWERILVDMPSLIYRASDESDPYIVPAARYPDGSRCLKIGGEPIDLPVRNADDLCAWFRSGGSPEIGEFHKNRIEDLFPGIKFRSWRIVPCAVTYTPSGLPAIGPVDRRVTVATGGCGAAGKSGDRIGWHAAEAAMGRVDPRFPVAIA